MGRYTRAGTSLRNGHPIPGAEFLAAAGGN